MSEDQYPTIEGRHGGGASHRVGHTAFRRLPKQLPMNRLKECREPNRKAIDLSVRSDRVDDGVHNKATCHRTTLVATHPICRH